MPIEEIENEYGCCPICGMNDGYLNLGEEQWFYCRDHRKRWLFGSGFFKEDTVPGDDGRFTGDGIPAEDFLAGLEPVRMRMTWP